MPNKDSEKSLIGNFARVTVSGTTISALCIAAPFAYASGSHVEAVPNTPSKAQGSEAQGSILTGYKPAKNNIKNGGNKAPSGIKSDYAVLTGRYSNVGRVSSKVRPEKNEAAKSRGSILTGYSPTKATENQTIVASSSPVKAQGSKSKGSVSVGSTSNSGSTVNLGNMTVTGQKPPSVVTRHKQKKAKNIVSVRSAKQIRQLPDVNAAEAISRQPGVTLESDSGTGRYVHIRGLSADLSTVTFAGVQLPPTNPSSPGHGGRAVALDTFPSGLIGSTSVTKTNMPDEDAGALGGTIEITPKSIPKSQNYIVQGHVGGGAKIQPGTPDYSLGLTVGKRFSLQSTKGKKYARKPFSVVGSVAYHNFKSNFPDREDAYANQKGLPHNAYSGFFQRKYRDHRKTLGFGGKVEYSPTKNSHYYIDYFNSGYNETLNKNELDITNLAAGAHKVPGGIKSPNAQYNLHRIHYVTKLNTQLVKFGGKNHFKNFSVNYHGSYARGLYNSPYQDAHTGVYTQSKHASLIYNNTNNPNIPTYRVVGGPQPTRIRGYNLKGYDQYGGSKTSTKIWTGAVNFTLPTDLFAQSKQEKFKFGLKTRLLTRKHQKTGPVYKSVGHMKLSSAYNNKTVTLYNHRYTQPGVNDKSLLNYVNSHPGKFPINHHRTQLRKAKQFSLDHEHIYAGYFQYHVKFHKLGILAGMRFEGTRASYHANKVTKRNGIQHVTPNTNHANYWNYFPTVQMRYAFTHRLIGRFVYSTAIARPGFNQVSASETINPQTNTISRGNPNLNPTTDNAFDFRLAYYMRHGVVSVNPFDKELNNYIVRTTKRVRLPNTAQYQGFFGKTRIHSYKNLNKARVYGVEFNFRQKFTFLPGALGNLGANVNYTYAHSSGKIHPHHSGMLPETSKHTVNAGVFYKTPKIGLHAAMQYRSKDIFGVGPTPSQDVYSQPRLSVSLGGHYQFRKHFQFYAQARNITNTPLEFTVGKNSNHQIQREYYGPTITGGIRINFGGGGSYARGADQANQD